MRVVLQWPHRGMTSRFAWVILGALTIGACDGDSTAPSEALVRVQTVETPPTAVPGTEVVVTISGTVGASGCDRLRETRREASAGRVTIRLLGQRGSGNCTTAPNPFTTVERVPMPNTDSLVLAIVGAETIQRVVRR